MQQEEIEHLERKRPNSGETTRHCLSLIEKRRMRDMKNRELAIHKERRDRNYETEEKEKSRRKREKSREYLHKLPDVQLRSPSAQNQLAVLPIEQSERGKQIRIVLVTLMRVIVTSARTISSFLLPLCSCALFPSQ